MRVSREDIACAVLYMLYVKTELNLKLPRIYEYMSRRRRSCDPETMKQIDVALAALDGVVSEPLGDEALHMLGDGLDQHQGEPHDLIDHVIDIVSGTLLLNTLTPERVKRLRRAILLPDEVAALQVADQTTALVCAHCRRPLNEHELVSVGVCPRTAGHLVSVLRCASGDGL